MQTTIVECHRSVTPDEDATSDQFHQLCRFCAKKNSCMMPIFRGQGLTDDLPSKIKAYVPVEVSEDDTLPLQICSPCVQCLTMWHEFITGCLKADENLRVTYQEILKAKAGRDGSKSVSEERDNQQIAEAGTPVQQQDKMSLSTVEMTNENEADTTPETGSNERCNTYCPDSHSFEVRGTNVISDTFKKRSNIENENKIALEGNVCLRRPIEKDNVKSYIMQKSCHGRIENTTDIISETNNGYECQTRNDAVQNTGSTVAATDFNKINTSNSDCPEMEMDIQQTITEDSRDKEMLNLCNSEHNKIVESKKQRKCDKGESPDLGAPLNLQSDAEEDILNQNGAATKQNPIMGLIERHDVKKKDKKSFRCSDCEKVFFQKDSFLRHLRIHTDERPFTCHICGKGFRDSGGLTRHLRDVHARVKNFKCDICGTLFAAKATCDDHRRTHTGERPFICAICGKRFSSKASHYMHAKTHTDIFPYNCNFCERHFRRRQELLVHKMTHTGERPCACDICGREFRVSGELQRHKFVHSKDKPYCCSVCGMSFRQKRYLVNHFKKQHKAQS
ncbi:zinc finger protein 41-like isoform X2 [Schistocerca nitens]|uniref:zinc finger protein 41-like isoform X2 n=1 Tax=Schistocerca nitens TaxID=7011 RepID=UPI0021179568|nr:zinc finger protein 41-like isoform X2 [Schistocerca nitens]